MNQFDIPVVLFFFKRTEKTLLVLEQIARVQPRKLYLISDGPRNDAEKSLIEDCRRRVEARIDWPCDVVRNYAEVNNGVYDRIGLGAQWVLRQEESAIFLEDDNLPQFTFFQFCEEMLSIYKDDMRVLWVCGTNYLKQYEPADGSSYVFTKHMLPCGWASWGHKFERFYEGDLELWDDRYVRERIRHENENGALMSQDAECWSRERQRIVATGRPHSWDYQMSFSLRAHGLFGIVPKLNQITNIGVDEHSTHGGTSMAKMMTRRFCGLDAYPMIFPLRHPRLVWLDREFELETSKIILLPRWDRFMGLSNKMLKWLLVIPAQDSLIATIKRRISKVMP